MKSELQQVELLFAIRREECFETNDALKCAMRADETITRAKIKEVMMNQREFSKDGISEEQVTLLTKPNGVKKNLDVDFCPVDGVPPEMSDPVCEHVNESIHSHSEKLSGRACSLRFQFNAREDFAKLKKDIRDGKASQEAINSVNAGQFGHAAECPGLLPAMYFVSLSFSMFMFGYYH